MGQQEWIPQVQEGVARLVDTAIRQLAQTQAPVANEPALGHGGQYAFPPVAGSMQQVQQHVDQNPAAEQRHLATPTNASAANQAQDVYARAQQDYANAMAAAGVAQQVQGVQAATAGMEQFAQLAGVQDPTQPQPVPPATPQIILPPGVTMEEPDGGNADTVSVLW